MYVQMVLTILDWNLQFDCWFTVWKCFLMSAWTCHHSFNCQWILCSFSICTCYWLYAYLPTCNFESSSVKFTLDFLSWSLVGGNEWSEADILTSFMDVHLTGGISYQINHAYIQFCLLWNFLLQFCPNCFVKSLLLSNNFLSCDFLGVTRILMHWF